MTEYEAAQMLLKFRKENNLFLMPSFETISAYGANGAIVHYRPEENKPTNIKTDNIYLLDSGGHYMYIIIKKGWYN